MRKRERKQLVSCQVHCWQEVQSGLRAPGGCSVSWTAFGASAEPRHSSRGSCLSSPHPPCPPVIDGLDLLKKEHPGARDGIHYLEAEFKKGNR